MGSKFGQNAVDYDKDHSNNVIREMNEASGIVRKYTEVMVLVAAKGAAPTVGNDQAPCPISPYLAMMKLVDVYAITPVPGAGDPTAAGSYMVHKEHETTLTDILSTPITQGDEEYCHDGVVNATYQVMVLGDILYTDVDAIRTGILGLHIVYCFKPVTPA
jgi:hypothetical protein